MDLFIGRVFWPRQRVSEYSMSNQTMLWITLTIILASIIAMLIIIHANRK